APPPERRRPARFRLRTAQFRGWCRDLLGVEDVALFTVHDRVDARELVLVLHAEADRLLDHEADDEGDDEGVDHDADRRDRLDGELGERAAEEETGLLR